MADKAIAIATKVRELVMNEIRSLPALDALELLRDTAEEINDKLTEEIDALEDTADPDPEEPDDDDEDDEDDWDEEDEEDDE